MRTTAERRDDYKTPPEQARAKRRHPANPALSRTGPRRNEQHVHLRLAARPLRALESRPPGGRCRRWRAPRARASRRPRSSAASEVSRTQYSLCIPATTADEHGGVRSASGVPTKAFGSPLSTTCSPVRTSWTSSQPGVPGCVRIVFPTVVADVHDRGASRPGTFEQALDQPPTDHSASVGKQTAADCQVVSFQSLGVDESVDRGDLSGVVLLGLRARTIADEASS
jgi:hypothetical protein